MAKRISFKTRPHNRDANHGPDLAVHGLSMVGPFPASSTPLRVGPYRRQSPTRAGKLIWSYWTGKVWSLSGTDFSRMLQRKTRASSNQSLKWYGVTQTR